MNLRPFSILCLIAAIVLFIIAGLIALGTFNGGNWQALLCFGLAALGASQVPA